MTSKVVQGTWLKKGAYGRFRGQCVNRSSRSQISLKSDRKTIDTAGKTSFQLAKSRNCFALARCVKRFLLSLTNIDLYMAVKFLYNE